MKTGPLPMKSSTERRRIVRRPASGSAAPGLRKQYVPEGHGRLARFAVWRATGLPAGRTRRSPGCAAPRFTAGAWLRLHRAGKAGRTPGGARRMRPVLAALSMLVAGAAFAASEDGHREHDPHEHGHGTLDVAVEGEDLVIELRMPGVNVVGFEHAPGTDAEREAVRQALARFRDPAAVLVPSPGAECESEQVEATLEIMSHGDSRDHDEHHDDEGHDHAQDGHEQDGHAHGEHGHDQHEEGEHEHEGDGHGHDERHDGEHESGEHPEDSGAETHSELHATYRFHCHAPERLDRIEVRVFELLHDAEEIEARVVTPTLQKAMDLHPGEAIVELSR